MDNSFFVFRASSLMLLLSMLQLLTGVFNAAFQGTPFAGWKQLLVTVAFMLAFHLSRQDRFLLKLLEFVLWGSLFLIVSSFIRGIGFVAIFYNIFFYIAWVPFFIWAALGGVKQFQKKDALIMGYLVIACIGLIVDLKTDVFSFLNIRNEVITIDYLALHDVANRAIFIFTASNLVMTVIAPMIVIFLLYKYSVMRLFFCFIVMAVVVLTTGSMNSVLLAAFTAAGVLYANARVSGKAIFITILVTILFMLFNLHSIDLEGSFGKQIDRIIGNTSLDSEANSMRIILWEKSLSDIGSFSFFEHLMGAGLGCTNANYNSGGVLYTHGESSFLQAYTEGGIVGLLFRLLPFLMLLSFAYKCKHHKKFMVVGYGIGILIVDALAPLFGNIFSQMLLGMLVGYVYNLSKKEQAHLESNQHEKLQPSKVGL